MGGAGCGGALIAPDVALFAAHCGENWDWTGEQISISAYRDSTLEGGAQERFCDEYVADPLYGTGGSGINYDFALCKLNEPVTVGAPFLVLNEDDSVPAAGEDLDVMGLGALSQGGSSPDYLHEVTVPAIDNDVCNRRDYYDGEITDIMLCAGFPDSGGKDSCQGDSGGPLVQRVQRDGQEVHLHVGVVSWGYGCAQPNWPGVYARTSKRTDWIKDVACNQFNSIADFCDNEPPAPTSCGNELKVRVTTDRWAYETEWKLLDSDDNQVLIRKYLIKNYQNDHTLCLEANECYTWEISDFDGIPSESYFLYVNDEEVASGSGNFAGTKKETFCTGADVTNPTAAPVPDPTEAPVPLPTPAPVPSPTVAPVADPTEAPVPDPTEAPSFSPTVIPVSDPTLAPTMGGTIWNSQWGTWEPTDSPTYLTDPPTWSPTDFPTLSPTLSPTEDFCKDSEEFFFKDKKKKTCSWVGKGSNKKVRKKCKKKWKGIRVYDWCPETCGQKVGLGQCAI